MPSMPRIDPVSGAIVPSEGLNTLAALSPI